MESALYRSPPSSALTFTASTLGDGIALVSQTAGFTALYVSGPGFSTVLVPPMTNVFLVYAISTETANVTSQMPSVPVLTNCVQSSTIAGVEGTWGWQPYTWQSNNTAVSQDFMSACVCVQNASALVGDISWNTHVFPLTNVWEDATLMIMQTPLANPFFGAFP
nr:hypothetical protein [Crucivirus sp.]